MHSHWTRYLPNVDDAFIEAYSRPAEEKRAAAEAANREASLADRHATLAAIDLWSPDDIRLAFSKAETAALSNM